jgi:hypothetical protein
MVGAKGFEPSTSWSRTRRASQAALRPDSHAPPQLKPKRLHQVTTAPGRHPHQPLHKNEPSRCVINTQSSIATTACSRPSSILVKQPPGGKFPRWPFNRLES